MSYLLKSDTQAACDMEGTSMLVQLGPEHEINLRCAPYELVPEYFINSLLVLKTRPGEHVHSHNLIRVS